ncbi:hypothetical protein HWV62_43196 [Athelia sp. TMB]|nr:hypothetical protein HWV62_43196 [Athelia sp. TMB]
MADWTRLRLLLRLPPIRLIACALLILTLFYVSQPAPTHLHQTLNADPVDPWDSIPPAPAPPPFTLSADRSRPRAQSAHDPLARLVAPHHRPQCTLTPAHTARYATLLPAPSPVFLALNLLDAQWPLAALLHELPIILPYLGPVFVSVLENGSRDRTPDMLALLAGLLDAHGAAYRIEVRGPEAAVDKSGGRRIIELARLRNEVMQPLYDGSAARAAGVASFGRVLFMNDIVFCAADMLEILHEHENQGADMTCALDWGSHIVYDRWVLRTMSGNPSYAQPDLLAYFADTPPDPNPVPQPLPADPAARARLARLAPFQVFSCWNGAAVMRADAFAPLSPSTEREGIRFRTARNDKSEVTERQSECFLVPVDMWRRGMGRVQVVPRASVTYSGTDYEEVRQDGGRASAQPHPAGLAYVPLPPSEDKDKIAWVRDPPARVAYHDYAWWHEPERWGAWDEA